MAAGVLTTDREALVRRMPHEPRAFWSQLLIDCGGTPRPYATVMEPFQREFLDAVTPAMQAVTGQAVRPPFRRFWIERPRGHSKTTDIAAVVAWMLFAAKRKLTGIAVAGDREQAKLIRDAIDTLVRLNPWLGHFLEVQAFRVINKKTGSTLEILSSDVASSYGINPSFIICDEICHWQKPHLWESLFSSAAKRPECLFVVLTNAGWTDTWQWDIREQVRQRPDWCFQHLDGPHAKWITAAVLAEQQALLPDPAFRRLWWNEWGSGSGDALSASDITAAIHSALEPLAAPAPRQIYSAGLDIGVKRDHSSLVVVGADVGGTMSLVDEQCPLDDWGERVPRRVFVPGTGHRRLATVSVWKPSHGEHVQLQEVEDAVVAAWRTFDLQEIFYDPWQAEHLAQRLRARGLPMREITFTGANLQAMASVVLEAFSERTIRLFPHPGLLHDLQRARIEEKSYGFRLTSPRDREAGHGDIFTAFMLALYAARNATPQGDLAAFLDAGYF